MAANANNTPKPPSPNVVCEYEAKCPQTWAWYPATITDFDPSNGKFRVTYPNDWKPSTWENATEIRPAGRVVGKDWRPSSDEYCECKAKAEENEPFGWWGCQVKSLSERSNGIYAFIQFDGWPEEHNEMLELEYLRPRNNNPALSQIIANKHINKNILDVPDHAKEWARDRNNLSKIKQKLIAIDFNPETSKLILIGTNKVLTLASGIVNLHFGKQKALYDKRQQLEKAESKLKQVKEREANAQTGTFTVHPFLSGYLMGKDSGNVQEVRNKIKDIVDVKLNNGECTVLAETAESVSDAIDMLQIVGKKVIIPRREMAPIIGKQGNDIKQLKNNVGVIRIISWSRFPEEYLRLKARHDDRYNNENTRPGPADSNENNNGEKDDNNNNNNGNNKNNKKNKNKNNNRNNNNNRRGDHNQNNSDNFNRDEDIRDILRRYGVKITKAKNNNNNNNKNNQNGNDYRDNRDRDYEIREYPRELEEEIHNFFNESDGDIIDLLSEDEKGNNEEEDALVIIGKKQNVNQCITMIMLQLNHIRKINNQKQRIRDLYAKLRDIKGYTNQSPRNYYNDRNNNNRYNNNNDDNRNNNNDNDNYDGQNNNRRRRGNNSNNRRDRDQDNRQDNRNDNRNNNKGKKNNKRGKGKQSQDYDSKEESTNFTPRNMQQRSNISVRRRKYEKVKKESSNDNSGESGAKGGDNKNSNKKSKKSKNSNNNEKDNDSKKNSSVTPNDDSGNTVTETGELDNDASGTVDNQQSGKKKRKRRRKKAGKGGAVEANGTVNGNE